MLLVLLAAMGMLMLALFMRRKGSGPRWVPVTLGMSRRVPHCYWPHAGGNPGGGSGGASTTETQAGTYTVKSPDLHIWFHNPNAHYQPNCRRALNEHMAFGQPQLVQRTLVPG